jgi:hypothetical protein
MKSAAQNRPAGSIGAALAMAALLMFVAPALAAGGDAAYPTPSPFPVSWQLTFTHSTPQRIVVTLPGELAPRAYWYMTYHLVNQIDQESYNPQPPQDHVFFPVFTLRTRQGKLIDANDNINPAVFQAIQRTTHIQFLENPALVGGRILVGQDQAIDSVAIWPEPLQRMGSFAIFASGMWGETAIVKDFQGQPLLDAQGNPMVLHRTLMMNYHVDGDATHFSPVRQVGEKFIMR